MRFRRRFVLAAVLVGAISAAATYAVSASRMATASTRIEVGATPIEAFDNRDPTKVRFGALEFRGGLALTAAYTIAKTLEQIAPLNAQDVDLADPLRTPLEKRLTQFDVPQQLSIMGTYNLPFFRRDRGWAGRLVGGWTFSGVFMSHSGFPINFPNAAPIAARSARLSDADRDARPDTGRRLLPGARRAELQRQRVPHLRV